MDCGRTLEHLRKTPIKTWKPHTTLEDTRHTEDLLTDGVQWNDHSLFPPVQVNLSYGIQQSRRLLPREIRASQRNYTSSSLL